MQEWKPKPKLTITENSSNTPRTMINSGGGLGRTWNYISSGRFVILRLVMDYKSKFLPELHTAPHGAAKFLPGEKCLNLTLHPARKSLVPTRPNPNCWTSQQRIKMCYPAWCKFLIHIHFKFQCCQYCLFLRKIDEYILKCVRWIKTKQGTMTTLKT